MYIYIMRGHEPVFSTVLCGTFVGTSGRTTGMVIIRINEYSHEGEKTHVPIWIQLLEGRFSAPFRY